jgi:D-glycero-alpha-D-manno-heptose-7-phosphate kinase
MESFKVTAPTRADLAGGTLDIWPLYCLTGGAKTINVALGLHAIAHFEIHEGRQFQAEVHSGGETHVFSEPLSLDECKRLSGPLQFPVAVISHYMAQQTALPDRLVRVRVESEAPLRSGLGGSSSLCVALVRGLSRLFQDYVDQGWQWKLLGWVRDMEASFLATPTGTQDYLAALFGGLNAFTIELGETERHPYSDTVYDELTSRLLILFSGEMHHSGLSNWELFKGAMEGDTEIIGGLRAIRSVTDQLDAELRAGNLSWKHIGALLDEEWRVRRNVFHVETKRLEEIIAFLHEQKVYGAKVCGAAQGGSLIALVHPESKNAVAQACEARGIKVLHTQCTKAGVTIHAGKESGKR